MAGTSGLASELGICGPVVGLCASGLAQPALGTEFGICGLEGGLLGLDIEAGTCGLEVGQPDPGNEDFDFEVEAVAIVRDTEAAEVLVLGIAAENSDFEVENATFDHGTVAVAVSAPGTETETGGLDKQSAGVAVVELVAAALDTAVTAPEYTAAVGSFAPDIVD